MSTSGHLRQYGQYSRDSKQESRHPAHNRPVQGRTQRDRNRRQFGQNFLRDRRTIARIVEVADPHPDLPMIEAGPGEGILTRELAKRSKHITSYEIDTRLAKSLRDKLPRHANIEIRNGDFLTATPPREPFSFVGAIPYGITSAIVAWCLEAPTIETATLVTQLEFARKRTGDYGRWSKLTVATWPRFEWEFIAPIDRRLFHPVPRVHSAIMQLRRRSRPLLTTAALARYESAVELGFTGVGGNIRASLQRRYPRRSVDAALAHAGVDGGTVVAYIHPEQWLLMFERLDARGGGTMRNPRRKHHHWDRSTSGQRMR